MALAGQKKALYMLAYRRRRYQERKDAGLCPRCGERPPYEDRVACLECRKEFRIYQQRYDFKIKAMKAQGIEIIRCPCRKRAMVLCIQCQAPLCDTCYDVNEGRCPACSDTANEQGEHDGESPS